MAELRFQRQRGLALITAVFVVAIVSTVAAFMALGQQIWIRQAQNFSDRAQGDAVARGAANYALMVLREDAKSSATNGKDDYTEIWAKPIATPVENGVGAGQIVDAQARFNLNDLVDATTGRPNAAFVDVFNRLLTGLNINTGITNAIIDWIDPNDSPEPPGGAESVDYLLLVPPYRAANKSMSSIEELRLIKGMDAKTFATLARYVVALPKSSTSPTSSAVTTINVNTADPVLLGALYTTVPGNLKQVAESRKTAPFNTLADFETRVGAGKIASPNIASAKSDFFFLEVQTEFGRVNRGTRSLIQRVGNDVQVLWQEQMLPVPPKTAPAP
jgi:general secretion pathway protein K